MTAFDTWLDGLTEHIRRKNTPRYHSVVNDCTDHRGADFCTSCNEEVDEDGNTLSMPQYCSRNCGCHGPGCPMGLTVVDE